MILSKLCEFQREKWYTIESIYVRHGKILCVYDTINIVSTKLNENLISEPKKKSHKRVLAKKKRGKRSMVLPKFVQIIYFVNFYLCQ